LKLVYTLCFSFNHFSNDLLSTFLFTSLHCLRTENVNAICIVTPLKCLHNYKIMIKSQKITNNFFLFKFTVILQLSDYIGIHTHFLKLETYTHSLSHTHTHTYNMHTQTHHMPYVCVTYRVRW
jgi:hypothetical protein